VDVLLTCLRGQVGKPPGEVDQDDVSLAVQTRSKHSFVPQPPVELLRQLADQVSCSAFGVWIEAPVWLFLLTCHVLELLFQQTTGMHNCNGTQA